MDKEKLNANVLRAIKQKVPDKTQLVRLLSDSLCIEKEAVYRRIRGDVVFTFSEIATLANELGLSLDSIVSSTFTGKSKPFHLKLVNYMNPTDMDYAMMYQYYDIIKESGKDPNSELMDCTNILPPELFLGFKTIEKIYLFKSMYNSGMTNAIQNLNEVKLPPKVREFMRNATMATKEIKNTYYIFDPLVFQYLVNDIVYFKSINLIHAQDVEILINELLKLILRLEEMAVAGQHESTGNNLRMYIASVNFDTSIWYLDIHNLHISLIKSFVFNHFISLEEESFLIIKQRISGLLRSATQISVSGERERINFFQRQREIVKSLNLIL